ncbi:hypothetical protein GUJ93_ZPchr0006g45175 [Zizania palustris]|uniref:Uncharacterized protein n=1 Tax=Zizania palustris TaxID=103762 RepID=A0A8J5SI37_ZIZPA|nr:hypothetical protein GUJ93_ZPchr0006g45175 [Zizania palustris]
MGSCRLPAIGCGRRRGGRAGGGEGRRARMPCPGKSEEDRLPSKVVGAFAGFRSHRGGACVRGSCRAAAAAAAAEEDDERASERIWIPENHSLEGIEYSIRFMYYKII